MESTALDFTYVYPHASEIRESDRGLGLCLATCGAGREHPHFFEGRPRKPRDLGDMLLALSDVVRAHFYLPRRSPLDPVVTSSEEMIRFEGFSGCCGVYARVDLKAEAFETELQRRGTTNVDFNDPMRAALTRTRDRDDVWLSVGRDEVVFARNRDTVIEKKVKLPVRWIKGFCEVQAYQPGLELRLETSAAEARRFLRSAPPGVGFKRPAHIIQWGKSLRVSPRGKATDVRIAGLNRIRVLEPLLSAARKLRVWFHEASGASGWEVLFDAGAFFLLVSPEIYRGFSGEGQALEKLALGDWRKALPHVQARLTWQAGIDAGELARLTGRDKTSVEAALAVLGSRGLTGFDAASGCYFHRVLPFDLEKVERMHPRLKSARELLRRGGMEWIERKNGRRECSVPGSDVRHVVRLEEDGDACTCPWHGKHQGRRGPCKHILAARLWLEEGEAHHP